MIYVCYYLTQNVLVVANLHVKRGGRRDHYEVHRERGKFVVCAFSASLERLGGVSYAE